MNTRRSNGIKTIAVLLAFAVVQVSLQLSFASPAVSANPTFVPQGVIGRITVNGTTPVTINGNNAVSGDSVPAGALVQTPAGTEATIDLGPLGTIEMSPNTRIRLDYSCPPEAMANPNPQACKVTITVLAGCIVSNYKQGTRHEVFNEQQKRIAESDDDKERSGGGTIRTCYDGPPPGIATAGGLGKAGVIGIIAAAAIIPTVIILAGGGDDPSPATP
jgi:hypothetical protein